ncbi:hypothetical protein [Naasia sp. SYSU D00057]|uniref:hypothetical protein n=1 Tax=Naasia sp. SYSU D00057 TaxID=2817380 RepID=UPI001B30C400|nr:hypothetical protein [Naasia sp. SYSU D00057]
MELLLGIVGAGVLLVGLGVAGAVALRSRGRRAPVRAAAPAQSRGVPATPDAAGELERAAGSALVRTDERIRLAEDELGFAIAELGESAAADLRTALKRAKQRLSDAFHLNQLLSDAVPDTETQRAEWNERIVSLCRSADSALQEQHRALTERRDTMRRVPAEIERVRGELARVRGLLPGAAATLPRLAATYSEQALAPIAANPEQAEQLIRFADRSLELAESRSATRPGEADAAVRAAAETAQRAEALIAAVERFEVEALQAESTLAAMVAESHAELAEARRLPEAERRGRIGAAIAALEQALAALPPAGERRDPVGSLTAIRGANEALDDAVAERVERAERRNRLRTQFVTAIDDAERQIATARQLITDYRAPVGPDARTRLAEAERELATMTDEREPEPALARARRAASLAAEAAALARADLEAGYAGWGSPSRGRSTAAPQVLGGVLGGLAIGGLLDDIGDLGGLGDLFD